MGGTAKNANSSRASVRAFERRDEAWHCRSLRRDRSPVDRTKLTGSLQSRKEASNIPAPPAGDRERAHNLGGTMSTQSKEQDRPVDQPSRRRALKTAAAAVGATAL